VTAQKYNIKLDRAKVSSTVKELESSSLFQCLVSIRELVLSDDETAMIFEVARRGGATLAELNAAVGSETDVDHILAELLKQGHLLEWKTRAGKIYRLSPKLDPPAPITPAKALEIRRNMTEAGRKGFLESYIRELYHALGDEGLRMIGKIMAEKGQQLADQISEVRGQSAKIVGLRFVELMKALGAPLSIVNTSDDEVRFRVERCAYNLQKGEVELCKAVSFLDEALVGELGCVIDYPKNIPKGDPYCEGVVTNDRSTDT